MAFNTFELNLFKHDCKTNKQIHIIFVGDNHDDIGAHCNDHLQEVKAYAKKQPYASVLFMLMGDYGDFCSTSERAIIRNSKLHDQTIKTFDDVAESRLMKRIKQFEFMKGRVIGVHNGNHDWKFSTGRFNGMYASEVLARELRAKHIGYVAYSVLQFKNMGYNYCSRFDIVSCHGKGGGKRIGAGFNTIEDMTMIFEGDDVYAQGHNHQLGGIPLARLGVDVPNKSGKPELKQRVIHLVRTGSAMEGYRVGEETYVSNALMKPCVLGSPVVIIQYKKANNKGKRSLQRSVKTLA